MGQEVRIQKLGGLELLACNVELYRTVYALTQLVRLCDNIAVLKGIYKPVQTFLIILGLLAGVRLKVLGKLGGVLVAQEHLLVVAVAEHSHAGFINFIGAQLVAVVANALYHIGASVAGVGCRTQTEPATLVEKLYKIVVIFAVGTVYRINGQEYLFMLPVNDIEVQLRQVLGIVDQHMICGDKILHPLCKAVVERLQEQIIDIAYVLVEIVLQIVLFDARGKVLVVMRPLLILHTDAVVELVIPLHLFIISIGKLSRIALFKPGTDKNFSFYPANYTHRFYIPLSDF